MAYLFIIVVSQTVKIQEQVSQVGKEAEDGLQLVQSPQVERAVQLEICQAVEFKRLQLKVGVKTARQIHDFDARHLRKNFEGTVWKVGVECCDLGQDFQVQGIFAHQVCPMEVNQ